jgi:uncharacterized protein YodC (DUF2158 family)
MKMIAGDVVRLRSGGPMMVVASINDKSVECIYTVYDVECRITASIDVFRRITVTDVISGWLSYFGWFCFGIFIGALTILAAI